MEKLIVIKTLEQLSELEAYIKSKEYLTFDTETTGIEKESEIIGFSVSGEETVGYYVILSYWDVQQQKLIYLDTKNKAKYFMELLKQKKLIMHNAVFDCFMVENNFQVSLIESVHTDTMILGHLLNENRSNGLKERGIELFGEYATKEQKEMKESVEKNGGTLTKEAYELYKADADLIAKYGAKDAILTYKVFVNDIIELYDQGLEAFFYEEESMPLLRGPTYDLNTVGLRIDPEKLLTLKKTLEAECLEAKAYIEKETYNSVKEEYPGDIKARTFNIGSNNQLSWLLFIKLNNEFNVLTKEGKNVCKSLGLRLPYSRGEKNQFIRAATENKGNIYQEAQYDPKKKKMMQPKKVKDPWTYISCGKETLTKLAKKYKWVEELIKYKKNLKLLNTYVEGAQKKVRYNIIRPSFLQHGTTSGRYSSKNPNFQNLPRKDKRVKGFIVSRPGKVFVGADYAQLEPRIFASVSKDKKLIDCFKNGDDFYSVIGVDVFEKHNCSLKKDDKNSFANIFADLRDISKVIALSATYGTTAPKMAPTIGKSREEAQVIIDKYFSRFPDVYTFMQNAHKNIKKEGQVFSLFGRPRRMPEAKNIDKIYGKNTPHSELPYEARKMLNLAVNHEIQSSAASIMNRAAIAFKNYCKDLSKSDPQWNEVKIVLQVHDELIVEGPEAIKEEIKKVLKYAMENTSFLDGVDLIAEPKIAYNIADLK